MQGRKHSRSRAPRSSGIAANSGNHDLPTPALPGGGPTAVQLAGMCDLQSALALPTAPSHRRRPTFLYRLPTVASDNIAIFLSERMSLSCSCGDVRRREERGLSSPHSGDMPSPPCRVVSFQHS